MKATTIIAQSCGAIPIKLGRMCVLQISGLVPLFNFRKACIEDFILHLPTPEMRLEATKLLETL